MQTKWDTWLKSLGVRRRDMPIGEQVRGQQIVHTVKVEGDKTASTLKGEVKAAPDAATALLTFTIGTPTFADGYTSWAVTIGSGWNVATDSDGDGYEELVYDFTLGGVRIFGGIFPISSFVTD